MDKADRNGPCPCGSGQKFKKCCLKWARRGLPSPPRNGLPNDPRPPGRALGVIGGGPLDVPYKQRWAIEKSGNYIWFDTRVIRDDAGNIVRYEDRTGWFTLRRPASKG